MPVQSNHLRGPAAPPVMTRRYEKFRGVDFSTDPSMVDPSRSPYALNIISDAGGYPEKRPGWKVFFAYDGGTYVNGIYNLTVKHPVTGNEVTLYIAHIGTKLFVWGADAELEKPVQVASDIRMNNARSTGFAYEEYLYILDGTKYCRFGPGGLLYVAGFIPTTVIGREPTGGGTPLEAVNLIQPKRKNSFIGNAGEYEVAQLQISSSATTSGNVTITLNGIAFTVAIAAGDSPSAIAGKIKNRAFTGWMTSAIGDTVTFTATTAGECSESQYSEGSTGATGFMITVMQGQASESVYQLDSTGLDYYAAVLTITSVAAYNGYILLELNGDVFGVDILTTDTVEDIALKVAAETYSGWSASAFGPSVKFTSTTTTVIEQDPRFGHGSAEATGHFDVLSNGVVTASVNGVEMVENVDFIVDRAAGTVTFVVPPPSGHGVDNVVITFAKTIPDYADRINKCTIATWFGLGNDSRLFVSGNPDYPNMDWQSGLYDPTYFPDTGYTKVGADTSAIMGYLKQFDSLLVIKEDNEQDATIYKRTAELDANNNAYFPLKQGVAGVGAVSKYAFANLRDDPLFLAKEGVFATTTGFGDVMQQRYVQERSFFVKSRLIKEPNLDKAIATVWNGWYILCVNGHCYVADSRQKTARGGNETAGYEWYYWDNVPATCFMVYGDKLYFGTADGRVCMFSDLDTVYRFADDGEPIKAIWTTIADDDGDWMRYKTIPKKGTGVMVKPYTKSSIRIFIRTESDTGVEKRDADMNIFDFGAVNFVDLTFNALDTPGIIPVNTMVKKYKTCQFILFNDQINQGFGVYGIIKRFASGQLVK